VKLQCIFVYLQYGLVKLQYIFVKGKEAIV
jgi:hypothetical protein